jgi:hypothetical protein
MIIDQQHKAIQRVAFFYILPFLAIPHVSRKTVCGHTLQVGFKGSSQNNNQQKGIT